MTGTLRDWIMGLVTAAVLASGALLLTPEGGVRRVTELVCGMVVTAMLLLPVLEIPENSVAGFMEELRGSARELTEPMAEREQEMLRPFIEERLCAYILDEAEKLGAEVSGVSVIVHWTEGEWLPREVYLRGAPDEAAAKRLQYRIASELGIPAERQHWTVEDE